MFVDADDEDDEDEDEEDDYLSINDDKEMSNMLCSPSTRTPRAMSMLHQKIIVSVS